MAPRCNNPGPKAALLPSIEIAIVLIMEKQINKTNKMIIRYLDLI
jgi:hypothetical protein